MKELLLAILIACSLGLGGCTEQPESTGNKQLDDALGIKTEEKVKEPKKEKKTEKEKSESKTKTETKKEYEQQKALIQDVVQSSNIQSGILNFCNLLACQNNVDPKVVDELEKIIDQIMTEDT